MRKALLAFTVVAAVVPQQRAAADFWSKVKDTGGKIIEQANPVTQVQQGVKLASGIVSGNANEVREGLGGVLLGSTTCLGCMYVGQQVLPNLDDAALRRIAGTGFLTFLADGDPVLVFVSTTGAIAQEIRLAKESSDVPVSPASASPATRQQQNYTGTATCLVERNGEVLAGWSGPVVLTNGAGQHTYPAVDLMPGDKITIKSEDCGWNDPNKGQKSLTEATLNYTEPRSSPNTAVDAPKQWLVGHRT